MPKNHTIPSKLEDAISDIVVDALNDVMIPILSDMHNDIKQLKENMGRLDNRVEMVNRKVTQITDLHADKLDNHEKRIKKLEVKRILN